MHYDVAFACIVAAPETTDNLISPYSQNMQNETFWYKHCISATFILRPVYIIPIKVPQRLWPDSCFVCCRLPLFSTSISDSIWTQRGFMLCLCLFSERWRERRTPPICGSSEKRRLAIGELLLLQQLVTTLWEGEGGGGCFKNSSPTRRPSLWRKKVSREGQADVATRDLPHNRLYLLITGVSFPALNRPGTLSEKTSPLPRQINAKRNNSSANIHGSRGSGEQSDKHAEKNNNRARIVAVAFSMHTLCARGTMKPEINAAVGFLSRFLRVKGHVNDRQVQTFSQSLQDILAGKKSKKKIVHLWPQNTN